MDLSRYLCIVPARSGSKRLPGKNFKPFAGKPLWKWAVDCAKEVGFAGERIVLTTDEASLGSDEVGPRRRFCTVHQRHPFLASDEASTWWAVEDVCYRWSHFGPVVVLQPTSPLRTAEQVRKAIAYHHAYRTGCVTASVSPHAGKSFGVGGCPAPEVNGGVFVANWKDWQIGYRQYVECDTGPDIDTQADWDKAEAMMKEKLSSGS